MQHIPGTCLKCKGSILVATPFAKEMRPFCAKCEQEINESISKSFSARGVDMSKKRMVFPKAKKRPKNEA